MKKEKFLSILQQYIDKGDRCMQECEEVEDEASVQRYSFWDGFHNCALNLYREIENL